MVFVSSQQLVVCIMGTRPGNLSSLENHHFRALSNAGSYSAGGTNADDQFWEIRGEKRLSGYLE